MLTNTDLGFRIYNPHVVSHQERKTRQTAPTYTELVSQQLGSRHERRLVRTARLVMRLFISHLWNDRMAHRQEGHEFVCDLSLPQYRRTVRHCDGLCLERVLGHLARPGRGHVRRRRARRGRPCPVEQPPQIVKRPPTLLDALSVPRRVRFPTLVDLLGIHHPGDARTLELHLVPGQRPSLVRKYKLDLAELFDEGGGAAEGGGVGGDVVHVEVRVDECRLLEFDDFHGDDEGDGDEVVVEDDEGEDVWRDWVSLARSGDGSYETFDKCLGCSSCQNR